MALATACDHHDALSASIELKTLVDELAGGLSTQVLQIGDLKCTRCGAALLFGGNHDRVSLKVSVRPVLASVEWDMPMPKIDADDFDDL